LEFRRVRFRSLFCHGYNFFEVWTMAAEKNEKMMDVTGHLSELRSRLMVTAFVFIIFFIIGFIFRKDIYRFFEKDIHIKLTILSPLDTVWTFLAIAGRLEERRGRKEVG